MSKKGKYIIVLAGLPFSGKTTLGKLLGEKYGIPFLDIDDTRSEFDNTTEWSGPEKEKEIMLEAYKRNHDKAASLLSKGKSVIVAATYSRETYHTMLEELTKNLDAQSIFCLLGADEKDINKRLSERVMHGSKSNITTLESYNEVERRYQKYTGERIKIVNTSCPLEESVKEIEGDLKILGIIN